MVLLAWFMLHTTTDGKNTSESGTVIVSTVVTTWKKQERETVRWDQFHWSSFKIWTVIFFENISFITFCESLAYFQRHSHDRIQYFFLPSAIREARKRAKNCTVYEFLVEISADLHVDLSAEYCAESNSKTTQCTYVSHISLKILPSINVTYYCIQKCSHCHLLLVLLTLRSVTCAGCCNKGLFQL